MHDNLTGLPNRELFMTRLEAVVSIARTEEKIRPSVLVIDIDRFKQVNEGLGDFGRRHDPAHRRAPPAPAA